VSKRWQLPVRVSLLLILLVVGLALGWQRYQRFANEPLRGVVPGTTLVVERGAGFGAVLARLREAGVSNGEDFAWRLLARQMRVASRMQVGEYAIQPGMTPRSLLDALRRGDVIRYRFTLVEGWNLRELRAALAKAEPLRHDAIDLDDAALMTALGHPGEPAEGRFLPETYFYVRGDGEQDLLRRAYDGMARALADAWASRLAGLPLDSPEQALTLASIIEKETGNAAERPQIAGVFVRRLQRGMRLQTDPTVIYGLGKRYDGNLRRRDLLADTPYNTYTRAGLPPTPICMPSRGALQAATHPAAGDALYFVAIGDGSGKHRFAATLAEHTANVRAYLAEQRARRQGPQ
jgi:UPF0755 protein